MAVDIEPPYGLAGLLRPTEGETAHARQSPMLRAAHNIDRKSAYNDLSRQAGEVNALKAAMMQQKMKQDRQKDLLHYFSGEPLLQRTANVDQVLQLIAPELAGPLGGPRGAALAVENEKVLGAKNAATMARASNVGGDVRTEVEGESEYDPARGATVTRKVTTKKKVPAGAPSSGIPTPPSSADTGADRDIHERANRAGHKVLKIEPMPDGSRKVTHKKGEKTFVDVLPPRGK